MNCHDIKGAFQHADVNIGWYPRETIAPAEIRTLPGGGELIAALQPARGLGLQSVRNPGCTDNPAARGALTDAAGRQWVWVYARGSGETGWIEMSRTRVTDGSPEHELTGPAGEDFEVGRGHATRGSRSGCGKKVVGPAMSRKVKARDLHFRYSPHGSIYHYLHQGDLLKVLITDGPQGFWFVEFVQAAAGRTVPRGGRGWVLAAGLEAAR